MPTSGSGRAVCSVSKAVRTVERERARQRRDGTTNSCADRGTPLDASAASPEEWPRVMNELATPFGVGVVI